MPSLAKDDGPSPIAASAAAAAAAVQQEMENSTAAAANDFTASVLAVASKPSSHTATTCAWECCHYGCSFVGVLPKDVCGEEGCDKTFHHGCQTNWEIKRYQSDNPDCEPEESYDVGLMKRCMIHHPHADMILEGLHIGDDGYPAKPVDNSSSSNGKPKKNNNTYAAVSDVPIMCR